MLAAVPAPALPTVRELAPDGVEVREVPEDGDLVGALRDVAFLVPSWHQQALLDVLGELPALRVVQSLSAGVEWLEPHVPDGVTLCSARGTRDVPVAEWVAGALLGVLHGLFEAARAQPGGEPPEVAQEELAGKRVLVLGMGSIGEAVRARLEPFGAEVVGVARHRRAGVEPIERLDALVPAADALVVLVPLTDETRGLVDARLLARLPDRAVVVNAGRGPVVDTDALLAELRAGRLRAALDVTDPEPLPPEHPLWTAPGAFVTPHVAGDSPQGEHRAYVLAGEQLRRFARGEPLRNVVRS